MRILKAGILSKEGGFTLIELTLVIFILTIMVLVTFPRYKNISSSNMKRTVRHLTGAVKHIYNESVVTKMEYRLNYDLSNEKYWVTVKTENNGIIEYVMADNLLPKKISLPRGMELKDVITLNNGKVTEGEAWTTFFPMGRLDPTTIHLGSKDKIYTLVINPLTGKIKVYNEYLEVD
ncbi:MAG: Tfp pilus assembly protein FimT/FimU [Nitrospirota bacterium]